MYRIETVQGDYVTAVERLNYVRINPNSGAWIPTDHISAELLVIEGQLYNIAGYPIINDYPIIKITEILDDDISEEEVAP